jgi:beta-glucosidase
MTNPLPYQDPACSIDTRVADLLGRMTLPEKVKQLSACYWGKTPKGNWADIPEAQMRSLLGDGIGQICQLGKRRTRDEVARLANRCQRVLATHSRLGIPALIHEETLHGMIAQGVTSLATPMHLAATWNPELVERSFTAVAAEMRGAGVQLGLSPVLDLGRDLRWGRMGETFGEDPHLVARMGVAAVRGLQGPPGEGWHPQRIIATGKHFIGYGHSEGGHNVGPFAGGWHELTQAHGQPWRAAIAEAGLGAVMPSYGTVEGEACHGSERLLTALLRNELGFNGLVVSDYGGVAELHDLHLVAESPEDAALLAITAGMDCELPNGECYEPHLVGLAERETAVAEALDRSVARVLAAKFRLGLFENPYVDEEQALVVREHANHDARQGAEEGMVLLRNDHGLLPLDRASIKRLAVVGPHIEENLLGPYFGTPRWQESYVQALREAAPDVEIRFCAGARVTGPAIEAESTEPNQRDPGKDHRVARLSTPADDVALREEAVELAQDCDAVVLCVGDDFSTTKESFRAKPHGDRADLGLLGSQRALFDALRGSGIPLVVVLLRHGVIADEHLFSAAGTLLDAGCGGQSGPTALARVLFGDCEPGGRLPISLPWSAAYLPVFSGATPAARRGYGFCTDPVAFPLGFGLSYTDWDMEQCELSESSVRVGEAAVISVSIRNSGQRPGSEVVQVYHQDLHCPRTRPARELVAFSKVSLEPGEERTLRMEVTPEQLGWFDHRGHFRQDIGHHRLWVCTGADPRGGTVLELLVS